MAGVRSALEIFIADQIKKYKGISLPLKAGMLERMVTKTLPVEYLHPNPADEFCLPQIGPTVRPELRTCRLAPRNNDDSGTDTEGQ